MPRYVTSTHNGARMFHLGTERRTACNYVFPNRFRVTDKMPDDRYACVRCIDAALAQGLIDATEAEALLIHRATRRHSTAPYSREEIAQVVDLLRQGMTDKDVVVRLGVSVRTVVRRVTQGMNESQARTRFEWGYKIGVEAGRQMERLAHTADD